MIEPEQSRMDPSMAAEHDTAAPTNAEKAEDNRRHQIQDLQKQRLKDALRENLRRRNAQRRGRSDLNRQTAE